MSRFIYGKKVGEPYPGHTTDVIGGIEKTSAGNLALRVGSVNPDGSWTQHKHVVLVPGEIELFLAEVNSVMNPDPQVAI
jgi:hypothetical protein